MRITPIFLMSLMLSGAVQAQPQSSTAPAIALEATIIDIPQSSPGSSWSFIGFGINTPSSGGWFVVNGTPRSAVMGKSLSAGDAQSAAVFILSEHIDQKLDSDDAFLDFVRKQHDRFSDSMKISRHDETLERVNGARCSRHNIEAQINKATEGSAAAAPLFFLQGLACQHPDDPAQLIEIGVSERGPAKKPSDELAVDREQILASLHFDHYSEPALQAAAEAARRGAPAAAEKALQPYIDAKAPWAEYLLSQILGQAPDSAARVVPLLEAAAGAGVADAQWSLGTLYLRGGKDVKSDPAAAEPLLRRAAEHGSAGASFQLGLAMLTGGKGVAPDHTQAALWIRRAAARGLKEAQDLLSSIPGATPSAAAPTTPSSPSKSTAPAAPVEPAAASSPAAK